MEGSLLEHVNYNITTASTDFKSKCVDKCNYAASLSSAVSLQCMNIVVLVSCALLHHISMLKRSYPMDLETPTTESTDQADKEDKEGSRNKKLCSSLAEIAENRSCEEEAELSATNAPQSRRGDSYRRYKDNITHVTQSRSIFTHQDSFVYGNPKELIKPTHSPHVTEAVPEVATSYDTASFNALDLSCKPPKLDGDRTPSAHGNEGNTYQNYHRSTSESPFSRSNLEIKLVSPTSKKPTVPEQLQIAKIQQQQRRSIQQQQKMLQQMRRTLDPPSKTASSTRGHHHHINNLDPPQGNHKNLKFFGNHDGGASVENQVRPKDEYHPPHPTLATHPALPSTLLPQPPYPYFDPNHSKELPDSHPILPLLDPVYFSALYNAHGFMPPSSPSIAAAFIGTLQDALPKLPLMFPSTSTNINNPLLPHKGSDSQH